MINQCKYHAGCFTVSGVEREDFYSKKIQNWLKRAPNTTNMERKGSQKGAKVSQGTFKITTCGTRSKKWGKRKSASPIIESHLCSKSIKFRSKKDFKKIAKKTWNFMRTGCQNGANIDAKTHWKSMPKLVAKKMMGNIKNHVFLMCKNM